MESMCIYVSDGTKTVSPPFFCGLFFLYSQSVFSFSTEKNYTKVVLKPFTKVFFTPSCCVRLKHL